MLFDDYVLRQIKKIAELCAAITSRASGQTYEDVDGELASAYQSLLGMQPEMAERLSGASLARMLGDPQQIRAAALLLKAHGDLKVSREDPSGAARLWEKALALLDQADDAELRAELEARLRGA